MRNFPETTLHHFERWTLLWVCDVPLDSRDEFKCDSQLTRRFLILFTQSTVYHVFFHVKAARKASLLIFEWQIAVTVDLSAIENETQKTFFAQSSNSWWRRNINSQLSTKAVMWLDSLLFCGWPKSGSSRRATERQRASDVISLAYSYMTWSSSAVAAWKWWRANVTKGNYATFTKVKIKIQAKNQLFYF